MESNIKISHRNDRFENIAWEDTATLYNLVNQISWPYSGIGNIDANLPSTFGLDNERVTTTIRYPWPNIEQIATRVVAVALVALAIFSMLDIFFTIACVISYPFVVAGFMKRLDPLILVPAFITATPLLPPFIVYKAYQCWNYADRLRCKQKGQEECNNATNLLLENNPELIPEAIHWFGKAAENRYPQAQRIYGIARMLSNENGCRNLDSIREGFFWVAQAAKEGDEIALRELSSLLPLPFEVDPRCTDLLKQTLFGHAEGPITIEEAIAFFKKLSSVVSCEEQNQLSMLDKALPKLNIQICDALIKEGWPNVLAKLTSEYIC